MSGQDRRDMAIEALLRRGAAAPPADEQACLDAETLAAWLDGGLPVAARDAAEAHVATCARCQVLVGAMARTEPVGVPVEKHRRSWLGWLVPLTAAAAALVLWVALPREAANAPEQFSARVEPVLPTATPVEPELRQAPPAESTDAEAPRAAGDSADRSQMQRREERAGGSAARADAAAPQAAPKAGAFDREMDKATPLRDERLTAVVPPQPPAAGAAPSAPAAPPAAMNAPARAEVDRSSSGAAVAGQVATLNREVVSTVVVTSPDGGVVWRAAAAGLERSDNGGVTWVRTAASQAVLAAGVCVSRDVCWFAGARGTVMRVIDGRTVAPVPFPQPLNLTAVTAIDADRATVTTAAGQSFTTTDAGATWRPAP